MNAYPSPPILFVVPTVAWFLVPVATLVLVAIAVKQLRSLNRNVERLVRAISDDRDR